jgi:predicted transcriptional regulator
MRVLWAVGEGTVHDIRKRLPPERSLAYTTVMTVMEYLTRKGVVERRRQGRAFVYQASVSEHEAREHALDRLTRNFFVSSRDRLRDYLGTPALAGNGQRAAGDRENHAESKSRSEIDPSLL